MIKVYIFESFKFTCPFGPREIDGLFVPPGKANKPLTINLSEGLSLPWKCGSIQTIHTYKPFWFTWMFIFSSTFWVS